MNQPDITMFCKIGRIGKTESTESLPRKHINSSSSSAGKVMWWERQASQEGLPRPLTICFLSKESMLIKSFMCTTCSSLYFVIFFLPYCSRSNGSLKGLKHVPPKSWQKVDRSKFIGIATCKLICLTERLCCSGTCCKHQMSSQIAASWLQHFL